MTKIASCRTGISQRLLPMLAGVVAMTGCSDPAEVKVRAASEVFVLSQNAVITGRDGAQSGVLFGKSVWAYGDTVLAAPDERGTNWHHNSFSFTSDFTASDGIDGLSEPVDTTG